jgi:stearoyl-CoA desaturase (delta-9 desaturase)
MDESANVPFDGFSLQRRKNRFAAVLWMPIMNAGTFIALPIYCYFKGVDKDHVIMFGALFFVSSLAITMGYHRFFAHSTFKAGKVIEFLLLFFGAGTYEESALKWASMHRRHHQFTDTDMDPYNIKRGFFYAHMGWFMFYKQSVSYNNTKDLQKSALVMNQHDHFQVWAFISGVALPLTWGVATGDFLSALLWGVAAKICLVGHTAFFINSFAHTFGSRPYDTSISARDNWVGALLTNGEGYHNYHHKFPLDYRNGISWYHWDPTKWIIWTLSKVGLAWDLRRTSAEQIRSAKLVVKNASLIESSAHAA